MCFDKSHFTCQCEKKVEKEEASGFKSSHFYWSFSSDIKAVKGLTGQTFASRTYSSGYSSNLGKHQVVFS